MTKHNLIHLGRHPHLWRGRFGNFFEAPRDLERAFEDWFGDAKLGELKDTFSKFGDVRIPVDFKENDKGFTLTAEVPGIDAKDLTLEFKDGFLTLKGEKKSEKKEEKEGYFHQECSYGVVSRTIELPENADVDAAKAEMKHGVLTLSIPKKEAPIEGTKKIEITSVN